MPIGFTGIPSPTTFLFLGRLPRTWRTRFWRSSPLDGDGWHSTAALGLAFFDLGTAPFRRVVIDYA